MKYLSSESITSQEELSVGSLFAKDSYFQVKLFQETLSIKYSVYYCDGRVAPILLDAFLDY